MVLQDSLQTLVWLRKSHSTSQEPAEDNTRAIESNSLGRLFFFRDIRYWNEVMELAILRELVRGVLEVKPVFNLVNSESTEAKHYRRLTTKAMRCHLRIESWSA